MDLEYRPMGTVSHAVSAAIAAVTTAVILWLVFTVAGDYYVANEQVEAVHASSMARQVPEARSNSAPRAPTARANPHGEASRFISSETMVVPG